MELWFTEEWTKDVRFSIKVKEHLHTEKSPFQQIDFFDSDEFGKFFTLDGVVMLTQKDEFIYHDMIVHVPMAVNPEIKRVLLIGAGDGGSVRELTRYHSIQKIEMVEIDERVVRLSQQYLPFTASKLTDKRVELIFDDGLKYVERAQTGAYDLIIVDSTDPIGPGEGLFSNEFYKNCYRALSDDGILINQNESPYFSEFAKEMKRAYKKIKSNFPIAKVYQAHIPTYESGHWLFGFASKKYDPVKDIQQDKWNSLRLKARYYNTELHKGAFALPNYVKEMLEEE